MTLALPSRRLAPVWVRNDLWRRARAVPSLDLRFASSKSLVDATTGQNLVTFSRASEATFVNSQGVIQTAAINAPRFDHNPTTGESLGLLVEESRTNLLTYSEEANNPAWNIIGSSILVDPDVATAPNGAQTADKAKEATTTGSHSIEFTGFAFQSGTTYTVSFYAKAAERSRCRVTWPVVFTNRLAFIDVSSSGYSVISDGGTVTSVLPVGNDWFRVVSTSTCTTASPGARIGIALVDTGTNVNYTGDGTSGIYIWGAQLEQGSFPTSYIKTEASTATRAADVASISGSNFSGWASNTAFTMFTEAASASGAAYNGYVYTIGADFNNSVTHYRQTDSRPVARVRTASADEYGATGNGGIWTGTSTNKFALALSTTSGRQASNGSLSTGSDDTSIAFPAMGSMTIGALVGNSFQLNGHIRRLTYFPQRLGNEVLQRITQ